MEDITLEQNVAAQVKGYLQRNHITYPMIQKELNISGPTITKYLSGKNFLPEKFAAKLSELYGFNKFFLIGGLGDLFSKDPQQEEIAVVPTGSSAEIINHYLQLLESKRMQIEKLSSEILLLENRIKDVLLSLK